MGSGLSARRGVPSQKIRNPLREIGEPAKSSDTTRKRQSRAASPGQRVTENGSAEWPESYAEHAYNCLRR